MTSESQLTLPDHETHNHWRFGLTCAQYEDMLTASGRCCELCGLPSSSTTRRKLFIDHDSHIGDWAVRGLLCPKCNAALPFDREPPQWTADYLAGAWWRRTLADLGISPDIAEPPNDRVLDFFDRIWLRRKDGWSTGYKKCSPVAWKQLVRKFGPHNLTPLDATDLVIICRAGRVVGFQDGGKPLHSQRP